MYAPDEEAIQDQVERLARNSLFARSKRLVRFLRFTVGQVLAGHPELISEHAIGCEVYDRREDFDPLTDGIVRAEAHRLRGKLRDYYRSDGRQDPIVIEYPVGSYVPNFSHSAPEFLPKTGRMAAVIRARDWSSTSLGPLAHWPRVLKVALSLHLRTAFPAAICWGPDLILLFNDAMCEILGDERIAYCGSSLPEAIADDWNVPLSVLKRLRDTGESAYRAAERWQVQRSGYREERYFDMSFSPVLEPDGRPGGMLILAGEVTDKVIGFRRSATLNQLAEHSLDGLTPLEACRTASRKLETNSYDIPFAAVYLLDAAGTSAELQATTGASPGTPVSPRAIALKTKDVPLGEAASSGRPQILNVDDRLGRLPLGGWDVPAREIVVLPLRLPQMPLLGFFIAGANPHRRLDSDYRRFFESVAARIAELVSHAIAVQDATKRAAQAEDLEQAADFFLKHVGDEFRTPLTSLLGFLDEALGSDDLVAAHRQELRKARRNALRLLKLVTALLDLVRIHVGWMQAAYEPVDLASVTDELVRTFRTRIQAANLRLVIDCPPLQESAFVDRTMWEKVVFNLLRNAIQHTHEGEIGVSVRPVGTWIELMVWDTGEGIPEQEQISIFEPFHRSGARTERAGGAGIGLALVRKLAMLHGGNVRVESAPGKGSKFTVSIPRGKAHLPADRIVTTPSTAAGVMALHSYVQEAVRWLPEQLIEDSDASSSGVPRVEWHRRGLPGPSYQSIVIAVQDTDLRQFLEHLTRQVYHVLTVSDGQAALDALRTQPARVLLADAEMPGLGGLALVRAVRSDPALASIPVIMLSARGAEEDRLRALSAGANDYIVKPFTARDLLVRIESQLALSEVKSRAEGLEKKGRDGAESQIQLLQVAFDQLPIGIVVVSAAGELIVKNRQFRDTFGSLADSINRLEDIPDELGTKRDGTPVKWEQNPIVRSARFGEFVLDEEISYLLPDQRLLTVTYNAVPLQNSQGGRAGSVVICRFVKTVRLESVEQLSA